MTWTIAHAATVAASHSVFIKLLLSFTLRTYQFLETNEKRKESVEKNRMISDLQKAQLNEAEYAPMIVLLGLYLSANQNLLVGNDNIALIGTTIAVFTNILYVYYRAVFGYPNVGIILVAVARYVGLILMLSQVWCVVTKLTNASEQ